MTTRLLLNHADVLVTIDPSQREIRDGALLTEDNRLVCVAAL